MTHAETSSPKSDIFAAVAVPGAGYATFTYRVPPELHLSPGDRVLIRFGSRKITGYVAALDTPAHPRAKAIERGLGASGVIDATFFRFCRWLSEYYLAPLASVLALVFPKLSPNDAGEAYVWGPQSAGLPRDLLKNEFRPRPGTRLSAVVRKRLLLRFGSTEAALEREGIIVRADTSHGPLRYELVTAERLAELGTVRSPAPQPFDGLRSRAELTRLGWKNRQLARAQSLGILSLSTASHGSVSLVKEDRGHLPTDVNRSLMPLNPEQQEVYAAINADGLKSFRTHLLQGVTGSGKTLIYAHLIREILARGQQVLLLTPEIALTESTAAVLERSFGDAIIRWHSGLGVVARREAWARLRNEARPCVVIGPRSALLTPLKSPGLIIVDEEHDAAYKQDDPLPYYHARDAAIMRAQLHDIPVLLGSATPSLESYLQAAKGKYQRHLLRKRATSAPLPVVRLIDMRTDRLTGDLGLLSASLKRGIDLRLSRGEQTILFLNRRGFSPQWVCDSCGWTARCEYCRQGLTFHRTTNRLHCHFCGGTETPPTSCPDCAHAPLGPQGHGTQRIESLLPRLFPTARILRYDLDSTRQADKAAAMLRAFAAGDADILLGTQMVTKGLDFPKVSLVGVLAADQGLQHLDFRASERTFARLVQVAGRAGRADLPGEVLLQTYAPDSPLGAFLLSQNYDQFAEAELSARREQDYPPHRRILRLVISSASAALAERSLTELLDRMKADKTFAGTIIRGPAPCPLEFVRGEYRVHAILQTSHMRALTATLGAWLTADRSLGLPKKARLRLDVDPVDMQ